MKKIKRISFDSRCLGDTIAWLPIVDRYRKVNGYDVEVATFWNEYFINAYPKLKFRGIASVYIAVLDDKINFSRKFTRKI